MKQRNRPGSAPQSPSKNRKSFGPRPNGQRPSGQRPDGQRPAARAEGQSDRPARGGKPFGTRPGMSDRRDKPHGPKAYGAKSRDFVRGEEKFDRSERKSKPFAPKSFAPRGGQRSEEKTWHPERAGNPFSRTGASTRRDKPRDAAPRSEEKFGRPERSTERSKGKFFGKPREAAPRDDRATDKPRSFKGKPFQKPFGKSAPQSAESAAKIVREGILLWGMHAVREALLNPRRRCLKLWATDATFDTVAELITLARANGLQRPDPTRADRDTMNQMLPPSSVHQGIVLEAALLPEMNIHEVLQAETPPDLVIVLDQVTDPHNVGAILRSAAAFGAGAVIMTERNAPTTTGVMAKTASGAAEHVPQIHVVNLARALAELQQAGYWCVGLAEEGERDLAALDLSGKTALVFGAEGDGLRRLTREHCDELARLPTGGAIGSLNVSNAAAVALYEVRRQKKVFK